MNTRSKTAAASAALVWLPPLAAGAVLRLWNLDRQILIDDEMHTVITALYVPVREILSSWKSEDPCLPLAALERVLLVSGVRFSELTFRAPVLAASLSAIVALPWLATTLIGRRAAVLFAWLLALSPVLVIYGGMVRPYGVIALLAPASVLLALRWRASGRLAWGLGYAAVAALCLWFHLATAPLLIAPFALLVAEAVAARNRGATARVRPRELAIVGATALALVALYVVPGWGSLRALYAGKTGLSRFWLAEIPLVLQLQAGGAADRAPAVTALGFCILAVAGVVVLERTRNAVAIHLLLATLAQWIGLVLLSPLGVGHPVILDRYLIGTLPLVLVFVAAALDALAIRVSARAPAVAPWLPALALGLVVAAGPFSDAAYRRSSFQHAKDFLFLYLPRGSMEQQVVPRFYRDPELTGSQRPLIEFPFRGGWATTRSHYVYQEIHGAPVLAAQRGGWPCDPRLVLRNHVCAAPARLLATEARFLVVHRDPLAEERSIRGGDSTGNTIDLPGWEESARVAGQVAHDLRRRWGKPYYRDDRITVWDLDAVRAGRRAGPAAASDDEPR